MQTIQISELTSFTPSNDDRFTPASDDNKSGYTIPRGNPLKKRKKPIPQSKQYVLPVPEECIVYKTPHPNYIRKYLAKIYPNLEMAAYLKCRDRRVAKTLVGDFVMYMLGETRTGIPRYQLYNPVKYPNQPYHKWLIAQVGYFHLDYIEAEQKYKSHNVGLVESISDDEEFVPNTLSMNSLIKGVENTDPFFKASADSICDYIKQLADAYNDEDVKICFESESHRLLLARLNDIPLQKFAKERGVKQSVAKEWLEDLKTLVSELYDGKEPSFG